MIDTQTLIMFLAKSLSELAQDFILYLDNLFINLSLATALEQLDIEIMRTVWVNALDFSEEIVQLKYVKESLKWEHLKTLIAKNVVFFYDKIIIRF